MSEKLNVFWFRRDLRLEDNAGLYHALKSGNKVLPIFIFDKNILDDLPRDDARVSFIFDAVMQVKTQLQEMGADLLIIHEHPEEAWKQLINRYDIERVYTNRDYEAYAKERDAKVADVLKEHNISFHDYKDHVIFDDDEVVKGSGEPYVVFTPYKKKWLEKLDSIKEKDGTSYYLTSYNTKTYWKYFHQFQSPDQVSMDALGFNTSSIVMPDRVVSRGLIKAYDQKRNFPAVEGTSRLGVHFRFGTISIREKARHSKGLNETFLSELIWRDFYSNILNHFPHVERSSFREKYDAIAWRNDQEEFGKWCEGKTGYPIVDAGMRQLNQTGYMHNRVRMIVASFLTKHLLIHWSWGEAYFAEKLLDYDLASNNGGWQWAAGSGTDAAPYFRVFNPYTQTDKFDKNKEYVKRWVTEYGTDKYPKPMVDHKVARERALKVYKEGLN